MTQDNNSQIEHSNILRLKIAEPEVSKEDPWADDALDRKKLGDRLTNLVRDQSAPFTVSIHGSWGTGKTFLLRRWQQDLEGDDEGDNFRAIYFNAWEDDLCDDALVAILGQLSDYFKDDSFTGIIKELGKATLQLMKQNAISFAENKFGFSIVPDEDSGPGQDPLESYRSQIRAKTELKEHLCKLSAQVREETGHPLVFMIDELDRCRPTFAIDVLEKVKHIFDLPNVVFVFGINRNELCSSLRSVYGEIDSSVYLRKFFDMEFNLPEADAKRFCKITMANYRLAEFFSPITRREMFQGNQTEFQSLEIALPSLAAQCGLSLRDIDYCVRTIALVGMNYSPGRHMFPFMLSILVVLKLLNPALYRQYVAGRVLGSEVMNYLDGLFPQEHSIEVESNVFLWVEAELYCADRVSITSEIPALQQLGLVLDNNYSGFGALTQPEYISMKTKESDKKRIENLVQILNMRRHSDLTNNALGYLAELIDLHQVEERR